MQTQSLLAVLPQLAGGKLLPARVAQELEAAYLFLRRLENRLQMLRRCADAHHSGGRRWRAHASRCAMGFRDWETCGAELDLHRARVTRAFQEVMFARNDAASAEMPGVNGIAEAWLRGADGGAIRAPRSAARGFDGSGSAPRSCCWISAAPAHCSGSMRPGARAWTRWCRGCWRPSPTCAATPPATQVDVLRRVLKVLEAIGSRSAYFALLNENAQVRRKLVELAALGEFLAAQIASHPLLLDELLDDGVRRIAVAARRAGARNRGAARAPGRGRARAAGGGAAAVPARRDFPRRHGRPHRNDPADAGQRLPHRDRRDHRRAGHAPGLGADDRAVRHAALSRAGRDSVAS